VEEKAEVERKRQEEIRAEKEAAERAERIGRVSHLSSGIYKRERHSNRPASRNANQD